MHCRASPRRVCLTSLPYIVNVRLFFRGTKTEKLFSCFVPVVSVRYIFSRQPKILVKWNTRFARSQERTMADIGCFLYFFFVFIHYLLVIKSMFKQFWRFWLENSYSLVFFVCHYNRRVQEKTIFVFVLQPILFIPL